jgi:acyl-coenzyme A thioesterase PaaI-like protein
MSAITEGFESISAFNGHRQCLLCGDINPRSLHLSFESSENGCVRMQFQAGPELQGFENILHGGVIASLLDAAMTHCLFHHEVQAVTGDLHIRYVKSIPCRACVEIRACLKHSRPPLYLLRAEIVQDNRVMAWGEAKFMQR